MTRLRALVLGGTLLLAAAGLWTFRAARAHGFSAREKPSVLEAYLARQARSLATDPAVRGRKNPVELTPLHLAEARDHFADHCAFCHANDGSGRTDIGRNMYPPAPDMRGGETQRLTDGEIFAIIRNGIRLSGMPGFGGEDEENWKLVLFLRHLPSLSPAEIELMREVNHLDIDLDSDPGASDSHAPLDKK